MATRLAACRHLDREWVSIVTPGQTNPVSHLRPTHVTLLALSIAFISACIQPGGDPTTTTALSDLVHSTDTSLTTSAEDVEPDLDALGLTERVGERCGFSVGRGYGSGIPVVHVGPVAFLAMDFDETAALEIDQPAAIKFVTVVDTSDGPVTISLDEAVWASVALSYDTEALFGSDRPSGPRHLAQGHTSIVFPCHRGPDSQYNGGFIVAAPVCALVRVTWGSEEEPGVATAAIPFGVLQDGCGLPDPTLHRDFIDAPGSSEAVCVDVDHIVATEEPDMVGPDGGVPVLDIRSGEILAGNFANIVGQWATFGPSGEAKINWIPLDRMIARREALEIAVERLDADDQPETVMFGGDGWSSAPGVGAFWPSELLFPRPGRYRLTATAPGHWGCFEFTA